jgi:glycosyltransferase involved in cell wall biosynthesis
VDTVFKVAVRAVAFGDGIGGMERAAAEHIGFLLDAGAHVKLFVPASSIRGTVPSGVEVVDVPWPRWDVSRLLYTRGPAYVEWTRRLSVAMTTDIVNGELWHLTGGAAGMLRHRRSREAGAPVIVNPQGMEEFGSFSLLRAPTRVFLRSQVRQARHASRVIATDESLVEAVRKNIGIGFDRIVMLQNTVDADKLRAMVASPDRHECFTIVSIGRIVWNKGYDLLLDALREPVVIAALPSHYQWIHFGAGRGASALKHSAEKAPRVPLRIISGASDREVQQALAAADLFVQPSRFEGSSLTTLEAMAHGRRVVATAVGGIPDKVRDGVTGYLAPVPTTEALAGAIARALTSTVDVGAAARQRVDEVFSSRAVHVKYLRMYDDLLKQSEAGRA